MSSARGRRSISAAVLFAAASLAAAPPPKTERRINLDVKDADIHNVLRFLAEAGKVDLVVSEAVQGRVTLRLHDVPWREALRVVLHARGLGFEQVGGILEIDTEERLLARARDAAEIAASRQRAAPLVTRMFPLSHARAADLKPLVASLLSPRGRVEIDARTNVLIVTDVGPRLDAVGAALTR